MNPLTKRTFAHLPKAAQREFTAWFRGCLQTFAGETDPNDMTLPPLVRAHAARIQRATELALQELQDIFGEKNDLNAHIGTRRAAE